jgi:c-src tyrosine kinase
MTREDAEKVLRPPVDGLFLVRESAHYPGDYTLCICMNNTVEHYHIIRKQEKLTIDDDSTFDNLFQLVAVNFSIIKIY